jgi:hypothetical protein
MSQSGQVLLESICGKLVACVTNSSLQPARVLTFNLSATAQETLKKHYPLAKIKNTFDLKNVPSFVEKETVDLFVADISISKDFDPELLFYTAKHALKKNSLLLFSVFDSESQDSVKQHCTDLPNEAIVYGSVLSKKINFFNFVFLKEKVFEEPITQTTIDCNIFFAVRTDSSTPLFTFLRLFDNDEMLFIKQKNVFESIDQNKEQSEIEEFEDDEALDDEDEPRQAKVSTASKEDHALEEIKAADESKKSEDLAEHDEQEKSEKSEGTSEKSSSDDEDGDKENEHDEVKEIEETNEKKEEKAQNKVPDILANHPEILNNRINLLSSLSELEDARMPDQQKLLSTDPEEEDTYHTLIEKHQQSLTESDETTQEEDALLDKPIEVS